MSSHKGFPIIDGKIIIDFDNEKQIVENIISSIQNNKVDGFINSIITVLLKIKNKELIGDKFLIQLSKEELNLLNQKVLEDNDTLISINIVENLLSTQKEIRIRNYSTDLNKCFDLIKDYDIDLQRRNNIRTLTIYDGDKTYSSTSNSLELSILLSYLQLRFISHF